MRLHVVVPAVSGNLGSGFDATGMALALYNEAWADTNASGICIEGEGARDLPTDERNLCVWAMRELARRTGRELPPCGLRLVNRIPVGRGLASSGAAVLSGLLLGNSLLGEPCTRDDLMDLGTEIEGHPDNVAAALLGGVVVSVCEGGRVSAVRIEPAPELSAVVWVPESTLATKHARAALPQAVPMEDAVYNVGRAALFASALATGRHDLLRIGAQDRLHQPYRALLVKGLAECMSAAVGAGALAAWLSGAGPSVLALCEGDTTDVETALRETGEAQAGKGSVLRMAVDNDGARVVAG